MSNDLIKTFFDTFGIEPKTNQVHGVQLDYHIDDYPQITDRILLELICIVSERRILPNCDVNSLKEYILKELCTMIMSEKAKQQVQELFKEG